MGLLHTGPTIAKMCRLDVRNAHRWIDTSVSSVSLLLNVYLFYLIMTRSSFKIKAFKWIFVLTCVSDFVLAAVVLIGQPVRVFIVILHSK